MSDNMVIWRCPRCGKESNQPRLAVEVWHPCEKRRGGLEAMKRSEQ